MPNNTHSDPRHFTLAELKAAADAAGITPVEAANNIVDTVADLVSDPSRGAVNGSHTDVSR